MEGFNFAPPDQKRKTKNFRPRGKAEEVRDERTVVVHANGRAQSSENSIVVDVHYLDDYSTEGLKAVVGKKLFGGKPAAGFYHDDGIVVSNMSLLKHGEVIYATETQFEQFTGSRSSARTPTKGAPTLADIEKEESNRRQAAAQKILLNNDDFISCATWIGVKKNYYFGTSDKGLGYHKDFWRQETAATSKRTDLSDLLSMYGGEDCLKNSDTLMHPSSAPNTEPSLVDRAGVPLLDHDDGERIIPSKPDTEQLKAQQRSRSATPPPEIIKRLKKSSSPSPPPAEVTVSLPKPQTPPPSPAPPAAPVGLAEKEEAAENEPKKEKMSKRARRRAKVRGET